MLFWVSLQFPGFVGSQLELLAEVGYKDRQVCICDLLQCDQVSTGYHLTQAVQCFSKWQELNV
ncbi:MAG: hypothetical protein CL915_13985 [Deltaproteobacteria bacterium]|nr:hypothetical protein [Deltaproteobacteria bacterium]